MKRVTVLVAAAFFAATAAWGYLHLEDFQSYDDGEDIADSPDWTNILGPKVRCTDLGYGVKIGTFDTNGGDRWGYLWELSEPGPDYGVSADFAYAENADPPVVSLVARFGGGPDYYCYVFNIYPSDEPERFTLLYGKVTDAVSWVTLWERYHDVEIEPEEWHNIKFFVYGADPVLFDLYLDEELIGQHTESVQILGEGLCGIHGINNTETTGIYMDNVMQLECPEDVGISPVSLGEVKATFR